MKFHVRSTIGDLLRFKGLVDLRKKTIQKAPDHPIPDNPVNHLVSRLHPKELRLAITAVREETSSARTYRLEAARRLETAAGSGGAELPCFRAGQFLSLKVAVDGTEITRAYSISSSPLDAVRNGFYEITIRRTEGGFLTEWIWNNWRKGTELKTSGPCGFFYHEPIRDSSHILALAGGSGITPFMSMIRDIVERNRNNRITLIYGTRSPRDIIFREELEKYVKAAPDRVTVHIVCSEPDSSWTGPKGFLTASCIRELAGEIDGKSVFICGPPKMYEMLDRELAAFNIPKRRIRRELMGKIEDITAMKGFPRAAAGKRFTLKVHAGGKNETISASAIEPVLVSLERARLAPPSECRSGECGFCRSRLVSGNIFVSDYNDGRRGADVAYGFFHPCASYPLSDLEIELP